VAYRTGLCLNINKTLEISNSLHMLLKQGPISHVVHTICIMRSCILSQWKKLSFKFLLLFDGAFQNIFEQILTHIFVRYWNWFEAFPYLRIRDAGRCPLKAKYLHITVVIWNPFKSRTLSVGLTLIAYVAGPRGLLC